jgi:AcrR family transcriptional regulator
MADIVRAAGTSVGLPYYYFGNKKTIFFTLWTEYQEGQQHKTAAAIRQGRTAGLAGSSLLLAGIRAYLEGAWTNRGILPMAHGVEQPAGFDDIMSAGAAHWNRQMLALLSDHDQAVAKVALLMLTEALSAVCLDLARCRSEDQAARTIENAVRLTGSLLGAIPARSAHG